MHLYVYVTYRHKEIEKKYCQQPWMADRDSV